MSDTTQQQLPMEHLQKNPVFIGSIGPGFDCQKAIQILSDHMEGFEDNLPVILDQSSTKQVEKLILSRMKDFTKESQILEIRDRPEVARTAMNLAADLKKNLGGIPDFSLKTAKERLGIGYKECSEVLNFLFLCGFMLRRKNKQAGGYLYTVISDDAAAAKFAQQRITEANAQIEALKAEIANFQQYLPNLAMTAGNESIEEVETAAKPKKPRAPRTTKSKKVNQE